MFGLIFFPDRAAGFRELRRILRPGARAVISSWAPLEGPFGTLMDIAKALVPGMAGPPAVPVLGHPEDYHREMGAAGFSQVRVESVLHERVAPSVEAFWEHTLRSNPSLQSFRRKMGQAWYELAPVILEKLQEALGSGEVVVRGRGHLGVGVK